MSKKVIRSVAITMSEKEHDELSDFLYLMKRFQRVKGVGYGKLGTMGSILIKDIHKNLSKEEKANIKDSVSLNQIIRKNINLI